MTKKVVMYKPDPNADIIAVGSRAEVVVSAYPGNHNIRSGYSGIVHTSTVLSVKEDGEFETLNSVYRPLK